MEKENQNVYYDGLHKVTNYDPEYDEEEEQMKESEAMTKIHSHERECAIRYENLEKRLEDGSKRFVRLEMMIWGLYASLAALEITARFV